MFTNAPDIVYLYTNRRTDMIPKKLNPFTRLANDKYFVEIANMKRKLHEKDGVLLYFNADGRLWYLPTASELSTAAALRIDMSDGKGSIYRSKSSDFLSPGDDVEKSDGSR